MAIRLTYGATPGVNLAAGFVTARDTLEARRNAASAAAGASTISTQFGALSRERQQKRALAAEAQQADLNRRFQAQQAELGREFESEQADAGRGFEYQMREGQNRLALQRDEDQWISERYNALTDQLNAFTKEAGGAYQNTPEGQQFQKAVQEYQHNLARAEADPGWRSGELQRAAIPKLAGILGRADRDKVIVPHEQRPGNQYIDEFGRMMQRPRDQESDPQFLFMAPRSRLTPAQIAAQQELLAAQTYTDPTTGRTGQIRNDRYGTYVEYDKETSSYGQQMADVHKLRTSAMPAYAEQMGIPADPMLQNSEQKARLSSRMNQDPSLTYPPSPTSGGQQTPVGWRPPMAMPQKPGLPAAGGGQPLGLPSPTPATSPPQTQPAGGIAPGTGSQSIGTGIPEVDKFLRRLGADDDYQRAMQPAVQMVQQSLEKEALKIPEVRAIRDKYKGRMDDPAFLNELQVNPAYMAVRQKHQDYLGRISQFVSRTSARRPATAGGTQAAVPQQVSPSTPTPSPPVPSPITSAPTVPSAIGKPPATEDFTNALKLTPTMLADVRSGKMSLEAGKVYSAERRGTNGKPVPTFFRWDPTRKTMVVVEPADVKPQPKPTLPLGLGMADWGIAY